MEDRDTDSADHWVLDLDGVLDGFAKWKSAAPIPEPRNQFGTVTLDGKIYAMGGQYHHDSGQRISRGSTSTIPTPIPGAAAPM